MKLNKIYSAILLSTLPLTPAFAAGLDRSGQSIAAFLQSGNYAEAGISILDPTVKGKDLIKNNVSDMAEDYYFPSAAIKVQATEHISLGLLYDQPFGADAMYSLEQSMFTNGIEGTKVEVETHNLTALIGYQPTENWNFYAGPVWQTVEADISLRGQAYISPKDPTKVLSGYDIKIHEEEAFGWLAGFAYQIPEIALKTSVTYRSEIKHKAKSVETHKLMPMLNVESQLDAITPQSVNIDFQTGIAANTLAFANIRWVHWDQFAVTPKFLNAASGNNLIDYSDDQWSATVGVGRKFNSHWSGSASVGWDSGAGNPVTTLGPVEGFWSVGLGGQYSPAENYFIQAGVKYFWLGDATARTGTTDVGEFEDNYALGYGLKIGYRF
ncbi:MULTISPECIES: OmpP1/FadL family transporter [Acinetobacter]|uniref:OmpP1/FadL family transporter n=1 Tax=Acinetobacter TaxID=469 RepID=UPI0015B78801|nr:MULTISPECIES: outer membrane protein transport protein [Acinetobacter]MBT0885818.1 outer membrane protein transport protein [Acinetobacter towneri]NWJ91225.1 outer membrane protein transport protein [Acinetobacter sp. Swhac1]